MFRVQSYTLMAASHKSERCNCSKSILRIEERTEKQMASLQSRLEEFKRGFESGAPPYNAPHEVIETMHRATAELKASGIEQQALKIGDRAPSFTLFNQDHVEVSSSNLLRQGPLVISFFRGHW